MREPPIDPPQVDPPQVDTPARGTPEPPQPDTQQKIFDAALRVFSCKGHDGARMQEIAELADINRALLHYYFRTKRHLYEAVFAHCFELYMRSFRAVIDPERPFSETLRGFVDHYIEFVRSHMDMARLVILENLSGGTLMGQHLARAFATHGSPQQRFEEAIVRAAERGEIQSLDPKQTIMTVISACVLFLITEPTVKLTNPAAGADFDAFAEDRKEHIFNLLYHGMRAREQTT